MKNARTVFVFVIFLALTYLAGGCAMFQRGSGDKELLCELLRTYEAALVEGDADKLISLYSENYVSPDGADYEEATSRLARIVAVLERWEVKVSTAETEIEIEGKTATLSPIIFESPRGESTLTMIATKEADGVWRITSTEMER